MIVVGTSAVVQPAASLPRIAKNAGAFVIEVNAEETPISDMVDDSYLGKAGEILPLLEKYF
jgi:NAD-dependent deacetylase